MRRIIACMLGALLLLAGVSGARVPTRKLGGVVIAVNGRPAVGAQVMVERSDGTLPLATRTDSHGRFLLKLVTPGLYDIRASDATAASVWKHNVVVRSRRETIVDLRLKRIPQPKGTVHERK
ncbi:MAG: carboxypeptidase-like regulatory domain-containing protein [Candidatus Acidiferrales bacterium]